MKRIKYFIIIMMAVFFGQLFINVLIAAENDSTVANNYVWYNCNTLRIEGKGWTDTYSNYDRLPKHAEKIVPTRVWGLSHNSAGLSFRFKTNANEIKVGWKLKSEILGSRYSPARAASGLDIYGKNESGKWFYIGSAFPSEIKNEKTFILPKRDEYMLNLPLYNSIDSLVIGVQVGKQFSQSFTYANLKPIVFYGTSITQGACASRPGMAATSIVSRKLDYPVINLGFGGSGEMEIELADLLAEIDASVYVIDCLRNMTVSMVDERIVPFVLKLRKEKPNVPIILVEDSDYLNISPTRKGIIVRKKCEYLISQGVDNLYFLPNNDMLGADGEGTADTSHPNDLGMMRQADVFIKYLTENFMGLF